VLGSKVENSGIMNGSFHYKQYHQHCASRESKVHELAYKGSDTIEAAL
jgi:hypothetical protein